MFKLIVLAAFVAVATAKPSYVVPSTSLVQERIIESHGNAVIHGNAKVVQSSLPLVYTGVQAVHAAPLIETQYIQPVKTIYQPAVSTLISEKSISKHGHSIVHDAPLLHTVHTAYASNLHYV
ncbi:GSCOCG00005538001-RA-CDS [Cotesia congregata]|nr:GSCOCG00005538001-RA-CDS [Cotesia congregata]